MLPEAAITHFRHLCADDFTGGWKRFAETVKAFDHKENQRGAGRGAGYAARLAELYQREFERRSKFIAAALPEVHSTFGQDRNDEVEAQLLDLGARTISEQFGAIEGSYLRRVQPFGLQGCISCLGDRLPLETAAIQNTIRRYFWTLRNVPVKQAPPPSSSNVFLGPVGAVQTGANAVANVVQQWTPANVAAVTEALALLKAQLSADATIDAGLRADLVRDVDSATAELKVAQPNTGRLLRWFGGIATAVQTIPAIRPALETVQAAARALGLPL